MSNKALTYKQVRDLTGIPLSTLYSMVCRRQLPHLRFGPRLVRFDEAEIKEWIERNRVPATSSCQEAQHAGGRA